MKKAYTFRLDPALVNQLDGFNGNRTSNLIKAIEQYTGNTKEQYIYNTEYIQHMTNEIQYLRKMNETLLISSIPLLSKIKMKLLQK